MMPTILKFDHESGQLLPIGISTGTDVTKLSLFVFLFLSSRDDKSPDVVTFISPIQGCLAMTFVR